MTNLAPLHQRDLDLVLNNDLEVSQLEWTETTKLSMMADEHIKNAALKLMGFGKEEYIGDDELKARWLVALRLEWQKRQRDKRATKIG